MDIRKDIDYMIIALMKSRDAKSLAAYRIIKTAIMEEDKKSGKPISDAQLMEFMSSTRKKCEKTMQTYVDLNRMDLASDSTMEITVLSKYLPTQMSELELRGVLSQITQENSFFKKADMGSVMKLLRAKHSAADMKMASKILNEILA